METTCRVFRTVYGVAIQNRPFKDVPVMIDLQALNGLNTGWVLHSKTTATNIVAHIANKMRKKLCTNVISQKPKLSIIIDDSTIVSKFQL